MDTMTVIQSGSIRDIVNQVNQLHICKSDIVTLLQDSRTDEFVLVYYK